MPQFRMIVQSRPSPGREDEYNDWYQNQHLRDIVAIPGFIAAQRLKMVDHVSGAEPGPYLAVYEIEAESAAAAKQALLDAAMSGRVPVPDLIDSSFTIASIYAFCGDRICED